MRQRGRGQVRVLVQVDGPPEPGLRDPPEPHRVNAFVARVGAELGEIGIMADLSSVPPGLGHRRGDFCRVNTGSGIVGSDRAGRPVGE